MSKWMLIAALAALVIVPSGGAVCGANEPEAKQSACGKSSQCTSNACKCEDCQNGACDKDNCKCAECKTAGCECTLTACSEEKCGCDTVSLAGCNEKDCSAGECRDGECSSKGCCKGDCASGSCGKGKCCDSAKVAANGACGDACSGCKSTSVLTLGGPSWFTITTPSPTSGLSNEVWQQISQEYQNAEGPVLRRVTFLTGPIIEEEEEEAGVGEAPQVAASDEFEDAESCEEQIEYRIQIVEDHEGCLSEYEDLRRGKPVMFAESKTLLPTMRVLEKHRLLRQISSPTLVSTSGRAAQIEIKRDSESRSGLHLEVASERTDRGFHVQLAMHAQQDEQQFEVKTALVVEPGQTIVLSASPLPKCDGCAEQCPVYVVLTPQVVK